MFELDELKGLIFVSIYNHLNNLSEDDLNRLRGEADNTITRYTGYTNTEIADADYSEIKATIKGPYAHILEHLALSLITKLPDMQVRRIARMHSESMKQLSAMPRFNPSTNVASRVVKIEGIAEW